MKFSKMILIAACFGVVASSAMAYGDDDPTALYNHLHDHEYRIQQQIDSMMGAKQIDPYVGWQLQKQLDALISQTGGLYDHNQLDRDQAETLRNKLHRIEERLGQ